VLSYTGGRALDALRTRLGARRVAPLYGSVDPDAHRPAAARDDWRCDLSYIGTYAADRQAALDALFLAPARARPTAASCSPARSTRPTSPGRPTCGTSPTCRRPTTRRSTRRAG
jgi:hypothetical protein